VINFPALQYLRRLRVALEQGYAPCLLEIAPEILDTVNRALALHEQNLREIELIGKPLTGLCDKVAPIGIDKASEWRLKPGVKAMELVYNVEALIFAVNEVRRD